MKKYYKRLIYNYSETSEKLPDEGLSGRQIIRIKATIFTTPVLVWMQFLAG